MRVIATTPPHQHEQKIHMCKYNTTRKMRVIASILPPEQQEKMIDVRHVSRDTCEEQEICVQSNKYVYSVGYMCEKLEYV